MLTDQEKAFAEEHHELVTRFLRYKRLNSVDFYDVVIFGYLKAVQDYCGNEDLKNKYSFDVVAWRRMRGNLNDHYKYIYSKKRQAVVYSLDMEFEDGSALKDYIGTEIEDFEWIEINADGSSIYTEIELEVLCSIYAGDSNCEIREKLSLSRRKFKEIQLSIIDKTMSKTHFSSIRKKL